MNIYEFTDYRDLIDDTLDRKVGRGAKVRVAEILNCNPGYISQVLSKTKVHFSPENIIKIAAFLKFEVAEEEFLLSLLYLEKSSTQDLKTYWQKKVAHLRKQHLKVDKQVKQLSQDLSDSVKATYYSHWAYFAIHMFVSIDQFESSQEIAKHLNISNQLTTRVVNFLIEYKLITKNQKYFEVGKTRIHLSPDSPLIKTHHQNFRNKAIVSLEEDNDFDIHYSAVLTLSIKDALKIRQMMLKFISDKEVILLPSPNEEIIGLNLDLFKF